MSSSELSCWIGSILCLHRSSPASSQSCPSNGSLKSSGCSNADLQAAARRHRCPQRSSDVLLAAAARVCPRLNWIDSCMSARLEYAPEAALAPMHHAVSGRWAVLMHPPPSMKAQPPQTVPCMQPQQAPSRLVLPSPEELKPKQCCPLHSETCQAEQLPTSSSCTKTLDRKACTRARSTQLVRLRDRRRAKSPSPSSTWQNDSWPALPQRPTCRQTAG